MFPNLVPRDIPAAYTPSELIFRDGKWRTIKGNSAWSATGLYIFVRLNSRFYVCKANLRANDIGHLELAHGQSVEYAGEIKFSGRKKRGQLCYWDNGSGHYKPPASAAGQAQLPIDLFRPRQD